MSGKIIKIIIKAAAAVFFLVCLYMGISCFATLYRALTQPYLMSGTVRFDYMGYYIMSAVHGACSVISLAAAIVCVVVLKKTGKNNQKSNGGTK